MLRLFRNTSLLLSLCTLVLVGCGGAETTRGGGATIGSSRGRPAWERSALVLLPRDAFFVGHLDGAQLRRSPYFPFVETTLRTAMHGGSGSDQELRAVEALLGGTEDVWFSVREAPGPDDAQALVVLRGVGVERAMRHVLAQDPPSGTHETKGHAEIWRNGADNAYVRLDAKTWVIVADGGLDELLARVAGTAQGDPFSDSLLRATAERVGFSNRAPVAVVAHLSTAMRERLAREDFPLSLLGVTDYVAGRLDPSNGIVVDLTADLGSADAAARAEDALRGFISGYAGNPMVALMGFSDILRRIELHVSGARLDVRASITDAETRSLLQRYGELLGSAITAREAPAREVFASRARLASVPWSDARR